MLECGFGSCIVVVIDSGVIALVLILVSIVSHGEFDRLEVFVYDGIGVSYSHEVPSSILEKFALSEFIWRYRMASPTIMPLPVPGRW